ncbi:hypothetical protein [Amycolatopsis pittospori]|uniref:hypothetical protein n=1 Tax=Amycolatopsis pittospori TaxID=2749434 RepID=UPI0015F11882|nr:hypothetical protein [Amycolatopsis pittospori]
MPTSLEDAVDRLYAVFASERRPKRIDHCSHCVPDAEIKRMLAPGPVREIPVDALRGYVAGAPVDAGTVDDYRYFLPRILHIAVTEGFLLCDLDFVLRRVASAGLRDWPAAERDAVSGLAHALWRRTLASPDVEAEPVLGAIAELGEDLGPYLTEWEAALTEHAGATRLLEFMRQCYGWLEPRRRLWVPGWPTAAAATVEAWLSGPGATTAVTAAAEVSDDDVAEVLLEILAMA